MTPKEFRRDVLPRVLEAWERGCFCSSPAFVRLVSLDLGPVALADAQVLIREIIEKRFQQDGPTDDHHSGDAVHRYSCPQCATKCEVIWEQFSINMDRSFVRWITPRVGDEPTVPYLVGFYGHGTPDHVEGFVRTASADQFLSSITRAGRSEPSG
jgi:hypothetical protein